MDDNQIGRWSMQKFKTSITEQHKKYTEEYQEMLVELADMWIVICGLKYRGSKKKFPDYEGFCKQYSVNPKRLRAIINKKLTICNKRPYVKNNKGALKRMKTAEEIKAIMLKKAEERGVIPSATFDKLVNFRARQNIDVSICPCSPNDKERGCISDKCCQEILETGTCHCRAYIRQAYSK